MVDGFGRGDARHAARGPRKRVNSRVSNARHVADAIAVTLLSPEENNRMKSEQPNSSQQTMTRVGFEPTTYGLKVRCSTS